MMSRSSSSSSDMMSSNIGNGTTSSSRSIGCSVEIVMECEEEKLLYQSMVRSLEEDAAHSGDDEECCGSSCKTA